ncbi:hypothetical protein CGA19_01905 [Staphylococcus equorum]|nr:hypothetical protein CGA19_01905 [Staphylococcus equorum]
MIKEIFNSIHDMFDMNVWEVIYVDRNKITHHVHFYYKSEARKYYNSIPHQSKLIKKVKD